ncbi:hypothetical protein EPO34_03010 [Patescibacteria group bacterium]|nr:MAG: hypothetical protein EPO34_03010 [Patescibacteria group bacterium]
MKEFLRVIDLDNPGKAVCLMIELLPLVGMTYAIIGLRPTYDMHPETGKRQFFFEKLSALDRVIYLAGEFYASGHVMRAIKQEILHGRHRTPALPKAPHDPNP